MFTVGRVLLKLTQNITKNDILVVKLFRKVKGKLRMRQRMYQKYWRQKYVMH